MFQFAKPIVLLAFFAAISFSQQNTSPVAVMGALKACVIDGKGQICGSGDWATTPVQVRGVSLGWSNTGWESADFYTAMTANAMVDGWKAEIIRVAYGEDDADNYNWARVKTVVDAAIAKGIYVIIDWHSHNAHTQTAAATTFFKTTVKAYHNSPNVIFEIYNEPTDANGGTWANIKTYANTIIGAIRGEGANNLILVGTPQWSSRPSAASGSYLADANVGYVFHFYAYSHKTNTGNYDNWPAYGTGIANVQNEGKPVFVTEWGTTHSDGGVKNGNGAPNNGNHFNTHDSVSSNTWLAFMDANKISSVAWNVNDKWEGSAFFAKENQNRSFPTPHAAANFTNESMMSESGKYIFNKLKNYAASAHWRTNSTPPDVGGGGNTACGAGCTIIDDFESGTGKAKTGEHWYIYTDVDDGGGSTYANPKEPDEDGVLQTIVTFEDGENTIAGVKDYALVKADNEWGPYVALGLDAEGNGVNYDLSKCTGGFSYKFKGSAHNFKVGQSDITDYNYHYYTETTASADWKEVIVPPALLAQGNWGATSPTVAQNNAKINKFIWELKGSDAGTGPNPSAITGSLYIDDFACLGGDMWSIGSGNPSSSSGGGQSPILLLHTVRSNMLAAMQNAINLQSAGNAVIQIYDLKGNAVRVLRYSQGSYVVPLSGLPKGLYIVKASNGSWRQTVKVTVK